MRKIEYTPTAMPLNNFISATGRREYVFNSEYQREYIWNSKLQSELILSVMQGLPIGAILVWDNGDLKEVIDGLQRISTLRNFRDNQFSLSGDVSRQILDFYKSDIALDDSSESKKLFSQIKSGKVKRLEYDDFPDFMKESFTNYLLSITTIRNATIDQIRNYFVLVQNAEKLKGGQVINSIPDNRITNFLTANEYNFLAEKLNFPNKKDDLLKFIVQYHGLFTGKLALGVSDSKIINYASKFSDLDPVFEMRTRDLFDRLLKSNAKREKMSKSVLKLLLAEIYFGDAWKEVDIDKVILNIENLLMHSKKIFGANIMNVSDINGNELNKMALLIRGTHSLQKVEEAVRQFDRTLW